MNLIPSPNNSCWKNIGLDEAFLPQVSDVILTVVNDNGNRKDILSFQNNCVQIDTGAELSICKPAYLTKHISNLEFCPFIKLDSERIILLISISSKQLGVSNLDLAVLVWEKLSIPASIMMIGLADLSKFVSTVNFNWKDKIWSIPKKVN